MFLRLARSARRFGDSASGNELSSTDAGFNPNTDLNCDGVVDISDFSLLAQDFGMSGDP